MTRRFITAIALIAIVALAPACRTKRKPRATTAENDGQLASVVSVADPRAAMQLVRGFHDLENGAWRWTMREFAVTLRPPAGSSNSGCQLELKFLIPETALQKLGAITLRAKIGGVELDPQTFSEPGEATYTREIPANALRGETATIEFSTDKAIPPSDLDQRELAIIVTSIGLTAK
jgi:hypothetical protein